MKKSILNLVLLLALSVCAAAQYTPFKIMVVPDTKETNGTTQQPFAMASDAANWACANTVAMIGLGDMTYGASTVHMANSWTYLYGIADACGIPYLPAVGNHDYDGFNPRYLRYFNPVYGPGTTYTTHPWYGGGQPAGTNNSSYIQFSAGGQDFMVIGLQFYAPPADIAWAQALIAANPNKLVIIETHGHLATDSAGVAQYADTDPANYGFTTSTSTKPSLLWSSLISQYPNIIMVLCGHAYFGAGGAAWRQDAAADGHMIPQILSDYEGVGNGGFGGATYTAGLGYNRIFTFTPTSATSGTVDVITYSSWCANHLNYCPYGATLGNGHPATHYVNAFSFSYGTN